MLYNLKPSEPLVTAKTSYSSSHLLSSTAETIMSFSSKANTNLDPSSFLHVLSLYFSFDSLHFPLSLFHHVTFVLSHGESNGRRQSSIIGARSGQP